MKNYIIISFVLFANCFSSDFSIYDKNFFIITGSYSIIYERPQYLYSSLNFEFGVPLDNFRPYVQGGIGYGIGTGFIGLKILNNKYKNSRPCINFLAGFVDGEVDSRAVEDNIFGVIPSIDYKLNRRVILSGGLSILYLKKAESFNFGVPFVIRPEIPLLNLSMHNTFQFIPRFSQLLGFSAGLHF
jgi:hypothetical protein